MNLRRLSGVALPVVIYLGSIPSVFSQGIDAVEINKRIGPAVVVIKGSH